MHEPSLAAARVARLATTDPDGRPHLVPIVFALDGNTLYSAVDRKPKRSRTLRRIENARARPDITVVVDPKLAARTSIVIEAGSHEESVRIAAADLVRVTGAAVTDISED